MLELTEMLILTLNPGSTNTKISLFDGEKKVFHETVIGSLASVCQKLAKKNYQLADIDRFAVRMVHGGDYFSRPTKITSKSLAKIREISELAPLHNPPAVKIIEEILEKKPTAQIWAIFDTAFHSTIPDKYRLYALPKEISRDLGIKKYGFHGTANQSAIRIVENLTKKKLPAKTIICHLGGGASVTAVKNGKSISNSMGFTPLEGLIMVSRAGDLDAGVIPFLMEKLNKSAAEIIQILNKESGIWGIAKNKNLAEVFANPAKNTDYQLAWEMYLARLEKYIWAYIGRLEGLDCLIFSGGTGENNAQVREKIIQKINKLGFKPAVYAVKVLEGTEMMYQVLAEK